MTGNYQEFLEFLIKEPLSITRKKFKIDRKVDEMGILLSLRVNPQDMGQVIGRRGSTTKTIRSMFAD